MSTIRPDLPSFPAPLQPARAPAGTARSDFFRAALETVRTGPAGATPTLTPTPTPAPANAPAPAPAPRPLSPLASALASAGAARAEQPPRPGALLDIRV